MRHTEVIVVGGGAAGLAAAITAARAGANVTILEHMDRVGKKILSTGNGKCNFTNRKMEPDCFRGTGVPLVCSLLEEYSTEAILDWFQAMGIEPMERNGYYYPASGQAASVLEVLRMECACLGVQIITGAVITALEVFHQEYRVSYHVSDKAEQLCGFALILAAGGKAAPVTGSDGSGYLLAKQLGHHVCDVYPALTNLHTAGWFLKQWAGVRISGSVSLFVDGSPVTGDQGELQLTDYGVSGIPVFQISHYAGAPLKAGRNVSLTLSFWPEGYQNGTSRRLKQRMDCFTSRTLDQGLVGLLPSKLIPVLIRQAGLSRQQDCHLTEAEYGRLADVGSRFWVQVTGTGDFKQAQVCAGGVDGSEIEPSTMESRIRKGLYFAGELIDVDGICGGYNLHFAFAGGMRAGREAAKQAKGRGYNQGKGRIHR